MTEVDRKMLKNKRKRKLVDVLYSSPGWLWGVTTGTPSKTTQWKDAIKMTYNQSQ